MHSRKWIEHPVKARGRHDRLPPTCRPSQERHEVSQAEDKHKPRRADSLPPARQLGWGFVGSGIVSQNLLLMRVGYEQLLTIWVNRPLSTANQLLTGLLNEVLAATLRTILSATDKRSGWTNGLRGQPPLCAATASWTAEGKQTAARAAATKFDAVVGMVESVYLRRVRPVHDDEVRPAWDCILRDDGGVNTRHELLARDDLLLHPR